MATQLVSGSFEQQLNKGDCFITVSCHKDKNPVFAILPCYPEQIQEQQSANWATQPIIARSSPISTYNDTSYSTISVSFKIHREFGLTMGLGEDCLEKVELVCRRALYPSYAGTLSVAAPKTTLVIGDFKAKGYVTSLSITWSGPIIDHKYQMADISLGITDVAPGSDNNDRVWSVGDVMPGTQYSENPFKYTTTWNSGNPTNYYK
jgi:hypothetical protein